MRGAGLALSEILGWLKDLFVELFNRIGPAAVGPSAG